LDPKDEHGAERAYYVHRQRRGSGNAELKHETQDCDQGKCRCCEKGTLLADGRIAPSPTTISTTRAHHRIGIHQRR
jgi:hypothetical protein